MLTLSSLNSIFHKRIISAFVLLLIILFCSSLVTTSSAQLPPLFADQLVSNGWNEVEGIAFDSTGRSFVWEKGGKVWIVDTNGNKLPAPLLDISEEVGNWRDHGLNGFALDPQFLTNGLFYLFYAVDRHYLINYGTPNYQPSANEYFNATICRVTRYQADATNNFETIVPNSRFILLGETKKNGVPLLHESHSGGSLVFGTDGTLIVSTGDAASYNFTDNGGSATYWSQGLADSIILPKENIGAFRAQLVDCLNGKLLRIDPQTGDGVNSNPYFDQLNPRSAKSRVWSLGLRNPFRITIRPNSGSTDPTAGDPGVFYIGDVGWGSWEDIHVVNGPAQNMGWPVFEGITPNTAYLAALTPNYDAPNPLFGAGGCTKQYFDFQDLIQQATLNTPSFPNPCNSAQQVPASIPTFENKMPAIDYYHGLPQARTGIYDINGNGIPVIIDDPASPVKGTVFNGNASVGGVWYTGTKFPLAYQQKYFHADYGGQWIRGLAFDSINNPDSVFSFQNNAGAAVYLTMNQDDGCIYYIRYPEEVRKICYTGIVNLPPVAIATADTLYGTSPLTVNFTGSQSADPENMPLTYLWDFGDGDTSTLADPSHVFNAPAGIPTTFTVTLTVTDDSLQTSVATIRIFVNNTPPVVAITSFNDGDLYPMSYSYSQLLQAGVSDAEHGPNELFYSWQTILHHNNHDHPDVPDTNKITSTYITPSGCDGNTFYFRIRLTVTDAGGLSTTVESRLYPACNAPVNAFYASDTTVCQGSQVQFFDQTSNFPAQWQWTFTGGNPSVSTLKNPLITYSTPGVYKVKLITNSIQGTDTLIVNNFIHVVAPPAVDLGNDSVTCGQAILDAGNFGSSYLWSTGETTMQLTLQISGTYSVIVTDTNGCSGSDSVTLVINQLPVLNLGNDTAYCGGTSLDAQNSGSNYLWSTGETNQQIQIQSSGDYAVVVTDGNGCTAADSVNLVINPLPSIGLVNDTVQCGGNLVLDAGNPGASYLWSDGSTGMTIVVNNSGVFSVTVTDSNLCLNSDSVLVTINNFPLVFLGNDTAQCGGSILLNANNQGSNFLWSDGSNNQFLTVGQSGIYAVTVTDTNACEATDSIQISLYALPFINLGPDSVQCGGSILLDAGAGWQYVWNDGSTNQSLQATQSGNYFVQVTDTNSCTGIDTVQVVINPLPFVFLGNDTVLCGNNLLLDAGNPGAQYLWSTSSTGQQEIIVNSGSYGVWVTDANGCSSSDSIEVIIHPLPVVSFAPFTEDTVCINHGNIILTGGSPVNGTYSGTAVASGVFNPQAAGSGQFLITYSYTDSNGCSNAASQALYVSLCTGISENPDEDFIDVYPVPATDELHLAIKTGSREPVQLFIYDLRGSLTWNKTEVIEGEKIIFINTKSFAPGVYNLVVNGQHINRLIKLVVN